MAFPNLAGRPKGSRNKHTVAFREAFDENDIKQLAEDLKAIMRDTTQKMADRLKAFDMVLKKLVADEIQEEETPSITLEQIQEVLKDAGFKLSPITE